MNGWLSLCSRVAYKECERCIACQVRQAKQRGGTRSVPPASRSASASASALLAACRKRPFFSTFPVFVPSLSWQIDRFWYSNGSKEAFFPHRRRPGGPPQSRAASKCCPPAAPQPRGRNSARTPGSYWGCCRSQPCRGAPEAWGGIARVPATLGENGPLLSFPYVYPEPVLVK
jgi:hypothetical protein